MLKQASLIVLIALLCNPAIAKNDDGEYVVLGWGASSCGKYITAVKEDKASVYDYHAYAIGFITAMNYSTSNTTNLLHSTDSDGAFQFLQNYCRQNPLHQYSDGIFALITELYPERDR